MRDRRSGRRGRHGNSGCAAGPRIAGMEEMLMIDCRQHRGTRAAVCAAVAKPVNFMAGIRGKSFSVAELAAAGVKRVSLATSLYRAAMTAFLDAAREVKDRGQFGFLDRSVTTQALIDLMGA